MAQSVPQDHLLLQTSLPQTISDPASLLQFRPDAEMVFIAQTCASLKSVINIQRSLIVSGYWESIPVRVDIRGLEVTLVDSLVGLFMGLRDSTCSG